MAQAASGQQVKVRQQFLRAGFFTEGKTTLTAGVADDPLGVEIGQRRAGAWGGVEGAVADQFPRFEKMNQRGVDPGDEFGGAGEAAADEFVDGVPDEYLHLRVSVVVVGSLDEDQAVFVPRGGEVELLLGL